MKRRRWGPLELVDDNGFTGPLRASYADQGIYVARCLCEEVLTFGHRSPIVTCPRCMRDYSIRPAKVG